MASSAIDRDKEAEFEEKLKDPAFRWKGVIIYSTLEDEYCFMPLDGYEGGQDLATLSKVNLYKKELSRGDRTEAFELTPAGEESGGNAYIFLRVDDDCEDEFIEAIVYYLNSVMTKVPLTERMNTYKKLLWSHRDALFGDFLYMKRKSSRPAWLWDPRMTRGVDIKYQSDCITFGGRVRVRAPGPDSVASSVSHVGSLDNLQDFDEGPGDTVSESSKTVAEKEKGKDETTAKSTAEPSEVDPDRPTTEGPPPSETEAQDEVQPEEEAASDAGATTSGGSRTVSEEEIQAEMQNVDIPDQLSPKLIALYKELPDQESDIPTHETRPADFKNLVARLRPFENAYLTSINKKRLAAVTVNKEWTANNVKKEMNRITKHMADRDRNEAKLKQKRYNAAKSKALAKKRKAAKAKAAEEKKAATAEARGRLKTIASAKKSILSMMMKVPETMFDDPTGTPSLTESPMDTPEDQPEGPPEASGQASVPPTVEEETGGPESEARPSPEQDVAEEPPQPGDQDDDDDEEVIVQHKSRTRSKRPENTGLRAINRVRRELTVEEEDEKYIHEILRHISDIYKEIKSIHSEQERQNKNINTHMVNVSKAMIVMAKTMELMKLKLMKQDMANELVLADAERNVTKLLPLGFLNAATDKLLTNELTTKVIATHIWRGLDRQNNADPTLTDIVIASAKVVFSNTLRAFLFVDSGARSDSDEAKRGWDRLPVPQGFIDLMENYVLKRWSGRMTPPKSPTARKRAWLNILGGHFGTEREKYFAHLAVPFTNAYDMVVDRYERRLTFHQQNHDPVRENRVVVVPSVQQELEWFAKASNSVSNVRDLMDCPVTNKVLNYKKYSGPEFTEDDVTKCIATLVEVRYGVPAFAPEVLHIDEDNLPDAEVIEEARRQVLEIHQGTADFTMMGLEGEDEEDELEGEDVQDEPYQPSTSAARSKRRASKSPGTPHKKKK